jgi:hypothetical protein
MDGEEIAIPLAPANNQYTGKETCDRFEMIYTYETPTVPATEVTVTYTVETDGRIHVQAEYRGQQGLPELPVFGMRFLMPTAAERYTYEGLSGETYPDRMANRILGMGDVLSLIEKAQENISIDENREKEMAARMKKGKFDFDDYLESMKQMRNMGGLSSILSMMPGMGGKLGDVESMIDEKQLARTEAIILSMTPEERKNPKLMNLSRKGRIAKGAGVDIAVVNQFEQSQKMMKQMPGLMGGKRGRGMFGGMKFPF